MSVLPTQMDVLEQRLKQRDCLHPVWRQVGFTHLSFRPTMVVKVCDLCGRHQEHDLPPGTFVWRQ